MLVGFWSYVRDDNAAEGGQITRLATRVRDEYAMLTGDELRVFVDREDILWGQEWQQRIDGALTDTAFFVPVVTPRYFRSEACRAELLTFAGHAASLGVSELLMPLYYVDVPDMSPGSDDELVALVAKTQYFDWRALRLEAEDSAEYRKGVNAFAQRLASIVAASPEPAPSVVEAEPDEDESPGYLEVMAEAEEAINRVPDLLERLNEIMGTVGEAVTAANSASESSEGFPARLAATHRLAMAIDEPSEEFKSVAKSYATEMVSTDAGVLTLIRQIEEGEISADDQAAVPGFFNSIRELSDTFAEVSGQIDSFLAILPATAGMSKVLRKPMRNLQEGLRAMKDGNAVVSEWRRRIDETDAGT